MNFVIFQEQLKFCYEAVQAYLDMTNTYSNLIWRERERERERESIVLRFVIFAFSNIIFSCILKSNSAGVCNKNIEMKYMFTLLWDEPFCVFTDI